MTGTRPDTLAAATAYQAALRPNQVAIHCEDRDMTFTQLHRESNRTARALLCAGIGAGARVAFLGKESEYYYQIAFACAKIRAVLVPINWRLTSSEVDHILRDSGAELIFVEQQYLPVVQRVRADLPWLRAVVTVDSADSRGRGLAAWQEAEDDRDLPLTARSDDAVVQLYTSGTTGMPKGAVLAHRSFFSYVEAAGDQVGEWIDWWPKDVNLISFPGFHVAGFAWFMHGFIAGATSVVMRAFIASDAVRLIQQHGVTTTYAAPAMLQMMLAEAGVSRETFHSLRKVTYGAAPISEALLRECLDVFDCQFAQIYASTETGSAAVVLPPADHVPGSPLLKSAGKACPGSELKIVDFEGRTLPPGEIGQVCVRTRARMLEYWNLPEATAKTIVDDWLMMGDAGYLDENAYLYLYDRINDTIIVAAQNIYPVEVENALREHPAVADAAVVGVPDERWGEAVHACVVLRPGHGATPRQLLTFLTGRIADFKIPTQYSFADELPRNPTGKVLRRQVRSQLAAQRTPVGA
jgi:fatty-acyl-CoA synthase